MHPQDGLLFPRRRQGCLTLAEGAKPCTLLIDYPSQSHPKAPNPRRGRKVMHPRMEHRGRGRQTPAQSPPSAHIYTPSETVPLPQSYHNT